MNRLPFHFTILFVFALAGSPSVRAEQGHTSHAGGPTPQPRLLLVDPAQERVVERDRPALPILVRPATLAAQIGELAGHPVKVAFSRVVGVFNPRAMLIDTATRLPALPGNRRRVLVLIDSGALRVAPASLVSSAVTVSGVARTLLGAQVSGEVAWPTELRPEVVERLEIEAAVLANSVQTADGIELTGRPTPR